MLYFPNLNGLRFVAALLVLITHLELFKKLFHKPNIWNNPLVMSMGSMGVDLFFVLSGFLITYLLLYERHKTATISVKKFYIRRILRIWPLYFFIILLTFFIIPFTALPFAGNANSNTIVWYGVILPNVALALYPAIHYGSLSWSIGVEEQFYLIWPWLVKYFKRIKYPVLLIMLFFIGLKIVTLLAYKYIHGIPVWVKDLIVMTRIECMAIGAYGAYLLFSGRAKKYFTKPLQLAAAIMIFPGTAMIEILNIEDLKHLFYSVCFLIIILNAARNRNTIFRLENPVLFGLGKISYGIYMYQYLAIVFAMLLVKDLDDPIAFNILYYTLSFAFVITIAYMSYQFLEKPFLKLKPSPKIEKENLQNNKL